MQFSSLGSSKMDLSETDFFVILTIQKDQICYVKHVLAPFYEFFSLAAGRPLRAQGALPHEASALGLDGCG